MSKLKYALTHHPVIAVMSAITVAFTLAILGRSLTHSFIHFDIVPMAVACSLLYLPMTIIAFWGWGGFGHTDTEHTNKGGV